LEEQKERPVLRRDADLCRVGRRMVYGHPLRELVADAGVRSGAPAVCASCRMDVLVRPNHQDGRGRPSYVGYGRVPVHPKRHF
jgi:hypothetical protein